MKFYEFVKHKEEKTLLNDSISATNIAKIEKIILERIQNLLPPNKKIEINNPASSIKEFFDFIKPQAFGSL